MKLSNSTDVSVYTVAGASSARQLPEWLIRRRRRSLKNDPEFAHRVELLQEFEFEEASSCVRVSEDGEWIMSTGTPPSWPGAGGDATQQQQQLMHARAQEHTSRRSTRTTYPTCPCRSPGTPTRSTRRSSCCRPTTPSRCTCSRTASSTSTRRRAGTTRRGSRATAAT